MPGEQTTFSIRTATIRDVDSILGCLREAFEAYRDSYTPSAFLDTVLTAETLQQRLETMCVFVAVSQLDEIVGTAACNVINQAEGHVRGMAVRPAWQGVGVASALLNAVESKLRDEKCSRISLDTTLPLQRAMLFYERQGFRRSAKVTNFFGMPLFEYVKVLSA